ncbi:MAG: ATP synthase F1 subunit delta, partial [Gemmatimonadota bacterium]|nr:ATP synthase F1 subunit delta [Gemmatimonadota bacterium]
VRALGGLLESEERFRVFLHAPQIPAEEKRSVIEASLGEGFHPLAVRFLYLVIDKHREAFLEEIVRAWRELLDERENRQSALVTTATPVDASMLRRIRGALEKTTGKTIDLEQAVDPDLLGGVVIKTGDTVIDGSVRARLERMRRRLKVAATAGPAAE